MRHPIQRLSATLAATLVLLTAAPARAQVLGLPRTSQRARTSQTVGISEIEVVYHRPGVKGRKIWGGLVPYGQVWRAGANENTIVVLSHPATIEGTAVPAGRYGLHMIPGEKTWTVMLSKDSISWGSFSYQQELDAVRAQVTPEKAEFKEWLQYEFDPHSRTTATLALRWEQLRVPLRIEVDTPGLTLKKLREDLAGHLSDRWQTWYDAAEYCLDSGLHSEEALSWIDRALEMQRSFAALMIRSGLLEGLGRGDEASKVLEAALELGSGNEIAGHGSQLLDAGDHEGAAGFLEIAIQKTPRLWWAWVRLADAYAALERVEDARASYDKALELAPEEQKAFVKQLRAKLDGTS